MSVRIPQDKFDEGAYSMDGVLYNSIGRVVSPSHCKEIGWPVTPKQEAAYSDYVDKSLAAYRASQPAEASAEEQYEMRAAFGPGVEVVDIITGRRHRTR